MQTFNCHIGSWKAEARVHEVDNHKLMAVISITDDDDDAIRSNHTVVFDHKEGEDASEETLDLVRRLLAQRNRL